MYHYMHASAERKGTQRRTKVAPWCMHCRKFCQVRKFHGNLVVTFRVNLKTTWLILPSYHKANPPRPLIYCTTVLYDTLYVQLKEWEQNCCSKNVTWACQHCTWEVLVTQIIVCSLCSMSDIVLWCNMSLWLAVLKVYIKIARERKWYLQCT